MQKQYCHLHHHLHCSAITDTWRMCSNISYPNCIWNVMAHAQKPDFVFRRNGGVHLNQQGRQFSRLLAAEVRALVVLMLDIPCSEVVWRVLATHSIHQFPLHFPSCASLCAITFQLDSTSKIKLLLLYIPKTSHHCYYIFLIHIVPGMGQDQ